MQIFRLHTQIWIPHVLGGLRICILLDPSVIPVSMVTKSLCGGHCSAVTPEPGGQGLDTSVLLSSCVILGMLKLSGSQFQFQKTHENHNTTLFNNTSIK